MIIKMKYKGKFSDIFDLIYTEGFEAHQMIGKISVSYFEEKKYRLKDQK